MAEAGIEAVPRPVHPRVCGEHHQATGGSAEYSGSSPRVRGTYNGDTEQHPTRRFIPACAGNIRQRPTRWPSTAVHPRVCGEHAVTPEQIDQYDGSSPRVRGT